MSHNLYKDNGFIEKQGSGRKRAWHSLGKTFEGEMSARDAVKEAGLDFKIHKLPLRYDGNAWRTLPDGTIERDKDASRYVEIPGQFALVRQKTRDEKTPVFLGTCGKNYEFFQNSEFASLVDRITQGRWTVETAGALGEGETLFFALVMGSWDIRGDEISSYLFVSEHRNGTDAAEFCYTPVRVVCQNTYRMGLKQATSRVSLKHHSLFKAEATEVMNLFTRLKEMEEDNKELLRKMAEKPLPIEDAHKLIEQVYPEPQVSAKIRMALEADGAVETPTILKAHEALVTRREAVSVNRIGARDLLDRFNDEFPQFANTSYSLYNAVTEWEDHGRRSRGEQSRAESVLFGERSDVKGRVFDLLTR
jgi:phage/plasmid-like protein (TIGR03299 family)